ncbi:MAG TPA: NAD-dependent succinate-semialdehyde dehydrogenase [Gemmatimonadaceae bacterium]|jgi:succinate-semialdehyde dehydrogenase/glutarate-semialdehyde dehydrogenase|nr:NAD-dependent succinate-semialdehyde dehydrogenase [Gemmatimonadaceae bacterium]
MPIATINPATGETVRTFDALSESDVAARLERAAHAFQQWRVTPVSERAAVVARAGEILEKDKDRFGRLMTLEMGKPLRAAIEEAAKCALACRYYAEHASAFVAPLYVDGDEVQYQPLGAVLAIMPWNFPFWQVIRFAAPALCAGNVGILKHASNVPQCALALEDLFTSAGAPRGVFQTLLIGSDRVDAIIADARIAAVTLTGSEPAGRHVAGTAGKHLKKTVLELGGSDPFVVMPSADIAKAADVAVKARTINNGQSCIAAKRFIVHERVAKKFTDRFVERMRSLRVGDPIQPDTDIGPLATRQIVDDLEKQVAESVRRGARVLTGGKRVSGVGNYFEPTVLTDIPTESPAYRDEMFGPVAALFRARDLDDAIRIANDTSFGLAAAAWTRDQGEVDRFIRDLEAGTVFINGMVASDPRFPFGGVKHSGYGRELGPWGLHEFVNIKTVRRQAAPSGNTE